MSPAAPQALEAALELAAAGIITFPCGAHKKPVCNWESEQTADPAVLPQLWAKAAAKRQSWWDPVLVGVPTGPKNGITVLDLDPRHGSDEWLKANGHRLPFTREHLTRSDGRHLFFKHREGLKNSASKIAPGVDIRAEGGFVIWWPAAGRAVLHGYPRSFSAFDVGTLHDFPDWLFELAKPKHKPQVSMGRPIAYQSQATANAAIDGILRGVATAPYGSKTNFLFWGSCRMGVRAEAGQIEAPAAIRLLLAAAAHAGWPEHEALKHIENGMIRGALEG